MVYPKILIFLSCFISASLAGSHSPCDPIYSNFLAFYPKFTSLAESNFEIFSSNASQYPIWTNGLLTSFGCKVFSSQIFLVNVISRWSGLSAKEIGSSILNYPKNPLPLPLSCIEDGIASIKQILTTQIVESEKIANKTRQLSTYNSNTSCEVISSEVFPKLQSSISAFTTYFKYQFNKNEKLFAELGVDDLYIQSFSSQCFASAFGVGIADFVNTNVDDVLLFINETSSNLPAPYNCSRDKFVDLLADIQEGLSFLPNVKARFWWVVAILAFDTFAGIFTHVTLSG